MDINFGDFLKLRTRTWASANGYVDETKKELDAYNDVILPFIRRSFRHMPDHIVYAFAEDLSKATKKNIIPDAKRAYKESRSPESHYQPFTVVVTTGCNNGHNYPIGKPVMVVDGNRALNLHKKEGRVGNNLPEVLADVRPATDKEIDDFMVLFKDKYLGNIMDMHRTDTSGAGQINARMLIPCNNP